MAVPELAGTTAPTVVGSKERVRDPDTGLTVVVISHDFEGMERVCDRVVRLDSGRVVADATRLAVPS